jgi:hypothetical protein
MKICVSNDDSPPSLDRILLSSLMQFVGQHYRYLQASKHCRLVVPPLLGWIRER